MKKACRRGVWDHRWWDGRSYVDCDTSTLGCLPGVLEYSHAFGACLNLKIDVFLAQAMQSAPREISLNRSPFPSLAVLGACVFFLCQSSRQVRATPMKCLRSRWTACSVSPCARQTSPTPKRSPDSRPSLSTSQTFVLRRNNDHATTPKSPTCRSSTTALTSPY